MNYLFSRWAVLILAFFGIADTAYLAQSEISGYLPVCSFEKIDGCRIVAESSYAHLFGIPLGVYGLVFYILMFILVAVSLIFSHSRLTRALRIFAGIGLIASLAFFLVQVFLIDAFCLYCDISGVLSAIIFIILLGQRRRKTKSVSK